MTRRVERKLQEVVVARYTWRHEAEFAAGFLRDAGIPYRLQIDDPSLGISVSAAATLWVLGADEARARDVLDINEQHAPRLSAPRSSNHPPPPPIPRPASVDPGTTMSREYAALTPDTSEAANGLTYRARAISVLGGMGFAGAGRALFAEWSAPALEVTVAFVAIVLILIGLVGWAPRAVRDLLRAISGNAP